MKKWRMLLAAATAFSLLLAGCSGGGSSKTGTSGSQTASDNKTITIGQVSEVANLNPMLYPRTPDQNLQDLIFDPLVGPTKDLSFEGILAKSWDISKDGKTYTFHLRPGVKWQDGVDFTAKDVAFTLNSLADPSYNGGNNGHITSIAGSDAVTNGKAKTLSGLKVLDDNTLQIQLSAPDASFLAQMYLDILPEHLLGKVKPSDWAKSGFNRSPVGTGKYKFVEWKSGQYIKLVRNDSYFGVKPKIKNIVYRFGDQTTLTTALMNGEIDLLEAVGTSDVDTVNANGSTKCVTYPTMNMYYVGLNQLNSALSDLRVRQALSMALDKPKIIKSVFGNYAKPTDDIFPSSHWSHSTTVQTYPYNPTKAESLLKEAGYVKDSNGYYAKGGKELHFSFDMVKKGQEADNIAAMIQQAWKAIGVKIEIRTQDFSTLAFTRLLPKDSSGKYRAVKASDFDVYMLGFGVEVDPDEYRTYFVSGDTPPNGMNFISYKNSTVDSLFAQEVSTSTLSNRKEIFHKIADTISKDIPWIPLYEDEGICGVSTKIKNFAVDFRGLTYQIEKWEM